MKLSKDREKIYLDKLLEQEREIAYQRYKLEEKDRRIKKLEENIKHRLEEYYRVWKLLHVARKFIPATEHAKLRERIKVALGIGVERGDS